jgi:hypothetical protein
MIGAVHRGLRSIRFLTTAMADVMYVREAVPALVKTLRGVCYGVTGPAASCTSTGGGSLGPTRILIAHGRNRFAESEFLEHARTVFASATELPASELHPDFQCSDVTVYSLNV